MKNLLSVNASLEIIFSDSLVCIEVMCYSIQFSAKTIKRKKNRNSQVEFCNLKGWPSS